MKSRIKAVRDYFGMTQETFAKKLDLSRTSICLLESGDRIPSPKVLKGIISVFNVSEDWLLHGNGSMFLSEVDERSELNDFISSLIVDTDPLITAILLTYKELPADDKRILLEFAKKFAKKIK